MKYSVVIPVYNAEKTILNLLESLMIQKVTDMEVILVDNNSTDNSSSIIKDFIKGKEQRFRLFFESKKGPAATRNHGAMMANGEWLIFLDSDCIVPNKWLEKINETISANVDMIVGNILPKIGLGLLSDFTGMYTFPPYKKSSIFSEYKIFSGGFPSAHWVIKRTVFNELGGFDESFLIAEDHEFCMRYYNSGRKILATNKIFVFHYHRSTISGMMKQSFSYGYGHSLMLKTMDKAIFILTAPLIKRSYYGRVRGWVDLSSADKKIIGLIILSFFYKLFLFLLFYYLAYMFVNVFIRSAKYSINNRAIKLPLFVLLIFLKSFSMTLGRTLGSFKNKVLCF